MEIKINVYHHIVRDTGGGQGNNDFSGKLDALLKQGEMLMAKFDEVKTSVGELQKDVGRMKDALTEARQALVSVTAALEDLKSKTNLSAEDQASFDDIVKMLKDTDDSVEEAVPEVVTPEPQPIPPTEGGGTG